MSTAALENQLERRSLNLPALISKPFQFVPCKWADVRQDKIELMRDRFKGNASTVLILKDNKFDEEHLAILKKSVLEDLIKINADLQNGEAAVKESMEGMVTAVNTLIEALKSDKNLLEANKVVKSAIKMVSVQIRAVVKTTIIHSAPPENKAAAHLSDEEQAKFEDLIANEED